MTEPQPVQQECRGTMAAVGMFDGVHLGHLHLLDQLRSEAAKRLLQPLAVTFSNHPLSVIAPARAPKLLSAPEAKMLQLASQHVAVRMLQFTPELRLTSARRFLTMLREQWGVKAMLLGFNNRFGHDAPSDFNTYRDMAMNEGIELLLSSEKQTSTGEKISSSAIRRHLQQSRVEQANALLGRPYLIQGMVEHGQAIGRQIGFPTANIRPSFSEQLIPGCGVYAGNVIVPDGSQHPAVVNIGLRPTLNDKNNTQTSLEAHIIDYDGDLYGAPITLNFVAFLRTEQRFPSLEALATQIAADRTRALSILQ